MATAKKSAMAYVVSYQILERGQARPFDMSQDEEINLDHPPWIPQPGDTINMMYGGSMKAFKVLTRHFFFQDKVMSVNVVMTPASSAEIAKRLKE